MTVADLLEALQDQNPDAEVRLAFQPRWPLEYDAGDVVPGRGKDADTVVYITEGGQLGYAPGYVFGGSDEDGN